VLCGGSDGCHMKLHSFDWWKRRGRCVRRPLWLAALLTACASHPTEPARPCPLGFVPPSGWQLVCQPDTGVKP
jgi:hypothetical protein